MFAALLSIMERSGLTTDASRPAVVSSIFLSSNGKSFAIVIVVLAAAIVVAGAGLDGLGDGVGVIVTFTFTFEEPRTDYHVCILHPRMKASILVN
jgi:hypothetical protein